MKLGVCGHGRHGKDTVAELLAEVTGLRYVAGTSYWARHLVFERLKARGHFYENAEACWSDRGNYRQAWASIIGEYNSEDPIRLYRDCMAVQDILTGIRWHHEFTACKEAKIADYWIYVTRAGFPLDPTCQITEADCDYVIRNDGTIGDLSLAVQKFARELRATVVETD